MSSELRIYDRSGSLREAIEAERERLRLEEGTELSFSQAAHRLIHMGKRALEQTDEPLGGRAA